MKGALDIFIWNVIIQPHPRMKSDLNDLPINFSHTLEGTFWFQNCLNVTNGVSKSMEAIWHKYNASCCLMKTHEVISLESNKAASVVSITSLSQFLEWMNHRTSEVATNIFAISCYARQVINGMVMCQMLLVLDSRTANEYSIVNLYWSAIVCCLYVNSLRPGDAYMPL